MKFNVAGLLQEPVGTTRHHDVAEDVGSIDAITATGAVKGHVKLAKTNAGILVTAKLDVPVRLTCGRCLGDFELPLALRFSEEYRPVVDVHTGEHLPEPEDPATLMIDEAHILDLGEALRQYALVALPIAPLCTATCAGLCPECGHNLNEGPCGCPRTDADSRWQALADLLKEGEAGEQTSTGAKTGARKRRKR